MRSVSVPEIKPSLANCPYGCSKNQLVVLPVFSQMFPLPTGIFVLLQPVNTHPILLIN